MTNKCIAIVALAACGRAGAPDQPRDVDASAVPVRMDAATASSADAAPLPAQTERLRIVSACAQPIWVAHSSNFTATQNVRLAAGEFHDYVIPAGGLASVRFWPKVGCDSAGHNCTIGDNGEGGGAPCGATG